MVVWGHRDNLVKSVYADEFARRISDARVEVLENAAHFPHLEQTERTLALVGDFLAGELPSSEAAARGRASRQPVRVGVIAGARERAGRYETNSQSDVTLSAPSPVKASSSPSPQVMPSSPSSP